MSGRRPSLRLVVRDSTAGYSTKLGKLTVKVAGDEHGSIRDAIKRAGFQEGDVVALTLVSRVPVYASTPQDQGSTGGGR